MFMFAMSIPDEIAHFILSVLGPPLGRTAMMQATGTEPFDPSSEQWIHEFDVSRGALDLGDGSLDS